MKQVVIIGGGFSGTAAAIFLSRRSVQPMRIRVVEPRNELGPGLAHSSPHPDHRLNGLPGMHAMYPEDPQHFASWLDGSGTLAGDPQAVNPNGSIYARRLDFGRYMKSELDRHARSNPSASTIEHVKEAGTRLLRTRKGLDVALASGRILNADHVVLALGWNATGIPGPMASIRESPRWLGDPWNVGRIAAIPRHARVLLIGAGLTAADTFAVLSAQNHQGPVFALSRRGLRPSSASPHRLPVTVWERLMDTNPDFVRRHGHPHSIRAALRLVRADMAAVRDDPAGWYVPFDELRDSVSHFWPSLPADDKRRFVRHLRTWYDAFRYRNPPQTERIVEAGVQRGQLTYVCGRLRAARSAGGAFEIGLDYRHGGKNDTMRADAVVNCTGPQPRPGTSGNPLWTSLIAEGLARDHPSGLGVDVDLAHRVLDFRGQAHDDLLAIGPPTMGVFGESTGVPFIACQIFAALSPLCESPAGVFE